MNKRASNIIMTVLLTLVLVIAVTGALGSGISKMFKKDLDNTHHYETLANNIKRIANQHTPFYSEEYSFQLDEPDLFMFFSTGGGNIKLVGDPTFEFERPEECVGKACLCYCDNQKNFWFVDESAGCKLKPQYLVEGNVYSCNFPKCTVYGEVMYFTNSRGSEEYYDSIEDLLEVDSDFAFEDRTDATKLVPIPLDISTLISREDYCSENRFFSARSRSSFTDVQVWDYNRAEQSYSIAKPLLTEYSWENGVVIGAMGFAMDKNDDEDRRLRAPYADFTIEKHSQTIYGVCLFEKCIFPDYLEKIKEEIKNLESSEKIKENIEVNFNMFESYVTAVHPTCIDVNEDDTTCVNDFAERLYNVFLYGTDEVKPKVIWKKEAPPPGIGGVVELYINDVFVDDIVSFPHPFPVIQGKDNISEITIIGASGFQVYDDYIFEVENLAVDGGAILNYIIEPYKTTVYDENPNQETIIFKLAN